ncbi:hypothetical protein VNO80_00393 [Phaseolus coccineus]|uniref:Uncharacterized protein n=1 Tax=Phaseolus coccineus TaxID=3886 RepID=A0AAN9RM57_PHACN
MALTFKPSSSCYLQSSLFSSRIPVSSTASSEKTTCSNSFRKVRNVMGKIGSWIKGFLNFEEKKRFCVFVS